MTSELQRAVPGEHDLDPLLWAAVELAASSTGSDAAGPAWLTRLFGRSFSVMAAPAPRAGLGAPTIAVLADTTAVVYDLGRE